MTEQTANLGRIPFRLRIGVTGHRFLDNVGGLVEQIGEVLRRIQQVVTPMSTTSVCMTVVSPLAEGADRLVAREVLRLPGAALEVPLPLPVDQYKLDFETSASKKEFDDLLQRASVVIEALPSQTRDEAYERVGYYVVDRCDVLIAVWDGAEAKGRGGTADIVARAMLRKMAVYWIDVGRACQIKEDRCEHIAEPALKEARFYNDARVDHFEAAVVSETRSVLPGSNSASADLGLQEFASWILPFFVRADQLAISEQRRYIRFTRLLFASAAAAVVCAAVSAAFPTALWDRLPPIVEAVLLLVVAVIYASGVRRVVHSRWISYRFLAERFRSALYLALADLGPRTEGGFDVVDPGDPLQDWIRRAFAEVWEERPKRHLADRVVSELRGFLAESWLGGTESGVPTGQIGYHHRRCQQFGELHRRLTRTILVLLGVTMLSAILHASLGESSHGVLTWSHVSLFLALSLPAIGGGLAATASDREYHRHCDRHEHIAGELSRIRSALEKATTLAAIRDLTVKTEQIMLEENRDWFGVLRFHGFEPHI